MGVLVAELRLDDRQYQRGVEQGEKRFARLGSFLAGSAKTIGTVGAGVLATAGTVGIKTAAQMEQARIAFTTMLGSGRKADAFLRDLSAFAAKTPFEFPELQTAASSLVSAGIEAGKVIPIMTTLGDVTSGMGTGSEGVKRATIALQQMNAAGRITGEDLNQLRDAGIPVYDLLASATGKSKAEVVALAQAGKLGKTELEQMMKALESGKGLERFSGLMAQQSQSLTGLWSTLKDTFSVGMATAIQPLIPLIKDGLGGAISGLTDFMPRLASGLQGVVTGAREFAAGLGGSRTAADGLQTPLTGLEAVGARLRETWQNMRTSFGGFSTEASGGSTAVGMMSTAGGALIGVMQGLEPVVTVGGVLLGFLADHADTLAKYLPLLIAAFIAYKAAQAAANIVGLAAIPVQAAQIASNFALAAALRAHAAALGYERVGMLARIGTFLASTAATIGNTVALAALRVGILLTSGAIRAITAVQWLMNAAMRANPIGLVVTALTLLVGALVVAYKNSETFRRIVDGAFQAVAKAGSFMWNDVLKPAFRTMLGVWLSAAEGIVGAAGTVARALGMDGLADKLDAAKGELRAFKDSTMRSLDIPDQTVNVTAFGKLVLPAGFTPQQAASFARRDDAMARRRATGGPIVGPGTGTSDSIPAIGPGGAPYLLSDGEHVLTAREVDRLGGHAGVYALRDQIRRLAVGGPILGVRASGRLGNIPQGARELRTRGVAGVHTMGQATIDGIAGAAARGFAASMANIGDPTGSTPNGQGGLGPAARRASAAVRSVFGFGGTIGGYANRNIAGTSTPSKHSLGKAIDVMTYANTALGQRIADFFVRMRSTFGVDNVIFNRRITNAGRGWRWGAYSGVSPHTDHPHIDFYDRGGMARGPGWMRKETLRPERVLSPRQTESFERLVGVLDRNSAATGGSVTLSRESLRELALLMRSQPVQVAVEGEVLEVRRQRAAHRELTAAGLP